MTQTFTLAHFSDVHLSPLTGFTPRTWNAKRGLGFFNWQRKRRFVHQRSVVDSLIADALSLNVDHIAITGDLINLGLPSEYNGALAWLNSIASPKDVTIVPGNHDIYSTIGSDIGVMRWAPYMGAEPESLAFPFVRRVGPVALIGLNSAVPTRPFFASGRLGAEQIEVASELLEKLKTDGAIRVVLIHHPPLPGLTPTRRALTDAHHFKRALERAGAELVLYGHNHAPRIDWLAAEGGAIPVICAGSASAGVARGPEPLACYGLYTFFKSDAGVRIRRTLRGFSSMGGPVVKISEEMLEGNHENVAN
jgi:3',5'-cyclic AMP phosphodiesterase CpdA